MENGYRMLKIKRWIPCKWLLMVVALNYISAQGFSQAGTDPYALGTQLFDEGKYDQAAQAFTMAFTLHPQNKEALYFRGQSYLLSRSYIKAEKDFTALEEDWKDSAKLQEALGYLYNEKAQYEKAISHFDQAIKLRPDFAIAYNNRGLSFQNLGKYRLALADYNSAIHLDSTFAMAYNNRGTIYFLNQNLDEPNQKDMLASVADFEKAIRLNPYHCTAHRNLALVFSQLGKENESLKEMNHAIDCDPENAGYYLFRSEMEVKAGDCEAAMEDAIKAGQLNSQQGDAMVQKGNAQVCQGDFAAAQHTFQSVAKSDKIYRGSAFYGLARASALQKDARNMLRWMRKSRRKGYFLVRQHYYTFVKDRAFESYKKDKRFLALLNKIRQDKIRSLTD